MPCHHNMPLLVYFRGSAILEADPGAALRRLDVVRAADGGGPVAVPDVLGALPHHVDLGSAPKSGRARKGAGWEFGDDTRISGQDRPSTPYSTRFLPLSMARSEFVGADPAVRHEELPDVAILRLRPEVAHVPADQRLHLLARHRGVQRDTHQGVHPAPNDEPF